VNREYKYPILIAAAFVGSTVSLAALLRKYTALTVEHFVDACRWIGLSFFSSGVHYVGFFILLIVTLAAAAFWIKAVFSLLKTQKKINRLLARRLDRIPQKLLLSSSRQRGAKTSLVVVDGEENQAFSFGIFSPKILISTGFIEKLSEKELEAVLLHEYYHLRRRHVPALLAGEVMAAALFFLPVLRDWVRAMRLIFEQEADAYAVSRQKTDLHLQAALAKTTAVESEYSPYPTFASSRRGLTPSSIPALVCVRKPTRVLLFSLGVAALGFLLLIFPLPTHAAPSPPATYSIPAAPSLSSPPVAEHCLPDVPGTAQVRPSGV
jgi:hypothetical protein